MLQMDIPLHTICYILLSILYAVSLLSSSVISVDSPDIQQEKPVKDDGNSQDNYQYEDEPRKTETEPNETKSKVITTSATTTLKPVTIPAAVLEKGTFIVKSGENTCLRATFKATFTVKYASKRSNERKLYSAVINLPEDVTVSGSCGANISSLHLSWLNSTFSLTINFETVKGERRRRDVAPKLSGWSAASVQFSFDTNDDTYFQSPTNAGKHTVKVKPSEKIFTAERHQSYFCKNKQKFVLHEYYKNKTINEVDIDHVDVELWKTQVQAFDIPSSGKFSDRLLCEADVIESLPKKNVVPIIVAGCLAILIIIVIVVYFITKNYGQSAYRPMS